MTYIIGSIQFGADGSVAVEYASADDTREGASLSHTLVLSPELVPDELAELELLAQRALSGALSSFAQLEIPEQPEDDDDDAPGPYDNPEERCPACGARPEEIHDAEAHQEYEAAAVLETDAER